MAAVDAADTSNSVQVRTVVLQLFDKLFKHISEYLKSGDCLNTVAKSIYPILVDIITKRITSYSTKTPEDIIKKIISDVVHCFDIFFGAIFFLPEAIMNGIPDIIKSFYKNAKAHPFGAFVVCSSCCYGVWCMKCNNNKES